MNGPFLFGRFFNLTLKVNKYILHSIPILFAVDKYVWLLKCVTYTVTFIFYGKTLILYVFLSVSGSQVY